MEKSQPKVSLILSTYNCERLLPKTLESIQKQTYSNVEVIIVDGASKDNTLQIIRKYKNILKFSIIWISEPDKGIYDSMNKGFFLSSGAIVAFFNDQFLDNDAIKKIVTTIGSGNYDGAHADLVYASDTKVQRYWRMKTGKIGDGWMPAHPTLYLKREIYEEYGLYNINYKCSADYEFMVRILKDEKTRLAYIPETFVRMFVGGTSNAGVKNYIVSFIEAQRALKDNDVKWSLLITFKRALRLLGQFISASICNMVSGKR